MRKWIIIATIVFCLIFWGVIALDFRVNMSTKSQIFSPFELNPPSNAAILVPWAGIQQHQPWRIYQERLDTALLLLQSFPELKLILSADNSREKYNETAVGLHYLLNHKVNTGKVFLDFAGFDTYDSIFRAKAIFQAEKLIIVSQEFALPRALFIANQLEIPAIGVIASSGKVSFRNVLREKFANVKAFIESTRKFKPHFLGEKIPLKGESNSSKALLKN